MFKLTINSVFKNHYFRNNRGPGKNVICFPDHHSGGHRKRRICSCGVTVCITTNCPSPEKLHAFAQFSLATALPINIGAEMKKNADYIEGKYVGGLKFHFSPTHWPYGWVSNKHVNKLAHCLHVYLFKKDECGTLRCVARAKSGDFKISSTKKRGVKVSKAPKAPKTPKAPKKQKKPPKGKKIPRKVKKCRWEQNRRERIKNAEIQLWEAFGNQKDTLSSYKAVRTALKFLFPNVRTTKKGEISLLLKKARRLLIIPLMSRIETTKQLTIAVTNELRPVEYGDVSMKELNDIFKTEDPVAEFAKKDLPLPLGMIPPDSLEFDEMAKLVNDNFANKGPISRCNSLY